MAGDTEANLDYGLPALDLREADWEDAEEVWRWRNDPQTRAASFDEAFVAWDAHRDWFKASLQGVDRHLLVVEIDGSAMGLVRFHHVETDCWTVGINLAPEARGQGHGPAAVGRAVSWLAEREGSWARVRAEIKQENQRSLRTFEAAGFREVSRSPSKVVLERTGG